MRTLGIIGSGDLGQLIAYHAIADKHFDEIVFFDDYRKKNLSIDNYKIIGKLSDIESEFEKKTFSHLIIGIGYKHVNARKIIFEKFYNQGLPFTNIIHSSSYIDKSCRIGKGVFILPGCTLDRNVVIGNNTLLNTACVIAHDTEIEAHCFLSPRVAIAGFCIIQEQCVLGINCTINDNVNICSKTQTGSGTVVTKSITDAGLYVGVPAKKIKNLFL